MNQHHVGKSTFSDNIAAAVSEVSQLYLGDLRSLIENIYTKPASDVRDIQWQTVASHYPHLGKKIIQLHDILKKAYLIRYTSSLLLNAEMDSHFADVGDGDAAAILIDLLYTRLVTSNGILKDQQGFTEEEKMKQELGIGKKMAAYEVTLADVIEAILLNQLRITAAGNS